MWTGVTRDTRPTADLRPEKMMRRSKCRRLAERGFVECGGIASYYLRPANLITLAHFCGDEVAEVGRRAVIADAPMMCGGSAIPSDIECSADCYRVGFGFKTEVSRCALDLHMPQQCSNRL